MGYLIDKNTVIIAGAVVVRETKGKDEWLLVKQTDSGGWEFCKALVRKGESSVRTAIRVMGEKAGLTTKVLDEAGRIKSSSQVAGRSVVQLTIYYLMLLRSTPREIIGFSDYFWGDYSKAYKKLESKKEKQILSKARELFNDWKKNKKAKFEEDEKAAEILAQLNAE
jgi:8-oxo-dGTP pyrophosphatase MutT (NUDIX family)